MENTNVYRKLDQDFKEYAPNTINDEERSVEVVAITATPLKIADWHGYIWNEYVVISGYKLPKIGQVPLCDSHERDSVKSVLGSFSDVFIDTSGPVEKLVGKVRFSSVDEAQDAFLKLKEGHLTDFSVGFRPLKIKRVEKGETFDLNGKKYAGPAVVYTEWQLLELSICPIGADPGAKARSFDVENENEKVIERAAEPSKKPEVIDAIETRSEARETSDAGVKIEAPKVEKDATGILEERERVRHIADICRSWNLDEKIENDLINRGLSKTEASAEVLNYLQKKEAQRAFPGVEVKPARGESFKRSFVDCISLKMGEKLENPAPGARELANMPLYMIMGEFLKSKGLSCDGNVQEIVQRALSTSDLPGLLIEGSVRSLLAGFESAEETWPNWTSKGVVQNFKDVELYDFGLDNTIKELPPGSEPEETTAGEAKEVANIKTYGRRFSVHRQDIINDDLQVLTEIPTRLGAGVKRHIGDAVYNVFANNPNMGDGKPLFSADHKNIVASPGAPFTVENVSKAILAMGTQKDIKGLPLNINPVYLLAPLGLKAQAETFFNNAFIGTAALPTTKNIYEGYFKRYYDARLDLQSPTTWYLVGVPQFGVRVFYLRGVETPYLAHEAVFLTDSIVYKVRFDYGIKAMSWRNFVKVTTA